MPNAVPRRLAATLRLAIITSVISLIVFAARPSAVAEPGRGYYRQPAVYGDLIVFVAEGDLWRVPAHGGVATRLTTHPDSEAYPVISPDGQLVAFNAKYDGPSEVYTMPIDGGLATRRTFFGGGNQAVGFRNDGRLLISTSNYSGLSDRQLIALDLESGAIEHLPLSQAAQGCFDSSDQQLFFTRLRNQGSKTKRYAGGTAEQLWRFDLGEDGAEAVHLTLGDRRTNKNPMFSDGRVYFLSDRDDTMNLWSMDTNGGDLKQHTTHVGWDIQSASISGGHIIYRLGADLYHYELATGISQVIDVRLQSDFDQQRERWIDKPLERLQRVALNADGSEVAVVARGKLASVATQAGRVHEVGVEDDVRYRDVEFLPGSDALIALSDASGENEFWQLGPGDTRRQLTHDAKVLRWGGSPSPDGHYLAHHDKNNDLHVLTLATGENRTIEHSAPDTIDGLTWSADSRYLAYVVPAVNFMMRIRIHCIADGQSFDVTTDRYDSFSPSFSPDGKWLYFVSARHLHSLVWGPWGPRQPEPFFDRTDRVYQIALQSGLRSPFWPDDELHPVKPDDERDRKQKKPAGENESPNESKGMPASLPDIVFDGIRGRIYEVPIEPGSYDALTATKDQLFVMRRTQIGERTSDLIVFPISKREPKVTTVVSNLRGYTLSADGSHMAIRRRGGVSVIKTPHSKLSSEALKKGAVDFAGWRLRTTPALEWRQLFVDAWRLHRDYFYDRNMHGVDWPAMRAKYEPLVARVTSRAELSDILAQMIAELSALHASVYGGDHRSGPDSVATASLGATFARRDRGFAVEHVYRADPDRPRLRAPLARQDLDVEVGDLLVAVNGQPTAVVLDLGELLLNRVGQPVRLDFERGSTGERYAAIVEPISTRQDRRLRLHEWEYTRRLAVEERSSDAIGYVHLEAMGRSDMEQWARDYFPVFDRQGLIIDMRHNSGGNIDSWILEKLLRKAWFYWQGRAGDPYWNMQYAFRGHLVVLCDEWTASDGEAFTEGFRRLGLGKVIGTRTWGGEIWLSSSNRLLDGGVATAAENGVYADGHWLIEGIGVVPDIEIDNLPHESYRGRDRQLDAAIDHLLDLIAKDPRPVPPVPPYPDKSVPDNRKRS